MELVEVLSLGEISTCAKMPLNEMDLISRTSKCGKSVLEIFDVDEKVSFSYDGGEEEEMETLDRSEQSDDRPVKMAQDIDCLIRQIESMQIAIRKRQVKKCSEDISEETAENEIEAITDAQVKCKQRENQGIDIEIKKKSVAICSNNQPLCGNELLEARSLRQAHNRIQTQIDELICRYRKLREIINQMRERIRCMEGNLIDLNSEAEKYVAWSSEVSKELKVCQERYNYLVSAKMSKAEGKKQDLVQTTRFLKYNAACLTKSRLKREIADFNGEVKDLVNLMSELHKELDRNMAFFESRHSNFLDDPEEFLSSLTVTVRLSDEFRKSGMKLEDGVN
ncbi:uncharacterized protein LOC27209457 [Drosophila simulans]|uniref:uncharacterized protein LOC27209457 n=1 Tax=Drosophila simulans TaxID=7240 RepID=UPI00078AF1BB|nr:uncharacterized protein LOC27209457 [Drosophila simulans]KMZ06028.1 uncharacterized protein Dsimw501_GD29615 [Drosophila simulans]